MAKGNPSLQFYPEAFQKCHLSFRHTRRLAATEGCDRLSVVPPASLPCTLRSVHILTSSAVTIALQSRGMGNALCDKCDQ